MRARRFGVRLKCRVAGNGGGELLLTITRLKNTHMEIGKRVLRNHHCSSKGHVQLFSSTSPHHHFN